MGLPFAAGGEVTRDVNELGREILGEAALIPARTRAQDWMKSKRIATRSICKWRLKCRAVADSLEQAVTSFSPSLVFRKANGKLNRASNAIECLREEFTRRTKTQTDC
jgi:transposase-like protein